MPVPPYTCAALPREILGLVCDGRRKLINRQVNSRRITAGRIADGIPGSEPVDTRDSEPLIVTVNAQGEYFINVGGDPLKVVALADVESRVGKILATNPKKMILVKGDKSVNYQRVVELMAALQRSGAPGVGLVTE